MGENIVVYQIFKRFVNPWAIDWG